MKNKILLILAVIVVCILALSLTPKENEVEKKDLYSNKIFIEIDVNDYGVMKGELYPDLAPITVNNFVKLVESEFYNGLTFHRVINDFMIQTGDPTATGSGGSDEQIKGEFSSNGIDNPLSHTRGVISMARASYSNDSASSQFFIVQKDSTYLDGNYAAFGKITEGLDIIDNIASVETNENDKPFDDITINTISIVETTEEGE